MAELKPSQRFSRAAKAERERLHRQRIAMAQRRDDFQARVEALEGELATIDERLGLLESLAGASEEGSATRGHVEVVADASQRVVGGSAIRDLALPILIRAGSPGPIHYREWYRLFNEAGYVAAGKRPDAVFLNQISRSPLVRATTKAGYYVLDTNVVSQLRDRLREQQASLGKLLEVVPTDASSLARHHEKQRELAAAIAKTERDLREAMRVLDVGRDKAEGSPEAKAA